jgi:membrane protein DedA with SNARE-associated domain/membrane-associated phospholipid phosphatase
VKPLFFVLAAAVLLALVIRHHRVTRLQVVLGLLIAAGLAVYGTGVIHLPDLDQVLTNIGGALGKWTYLLVGGLAFLETGAFIGLIAPGETAIIVGGVVAGQGEINLIVLIAIVWAAAVAGDVTSFFLGRRLGRAFLVEHGPKVKITPDRLETVEAFFDRHGGKAIFLGRFVGLVRAIAPFLAGSSAMKLRRFLPYDVLGAGLWASTFCLLGFIFWRSLDQVLAIAKQGALALGIIISVVVGIVVAVRWLRESAHRARLMAFVDQQERKPVVGPVVRAGHRLVDWLQGPARFLWRRLTPGELGLELTTLLAVAAVGSFAFFGYLILIDDGVLETAGDTRVVRWALDLRDQDALDIVRVLTALGTFAVIAVATVAASAWCVIRRRVAEAVVLVGGGLLTYAAVQITKALVERPRPSIAVFDASGWSYPSGHAAHAVTYVAIAVVLTRTRSRRAKTLAVGGALALTAFIGATRLYLGVHYLSDVLGGYGLGAAIFAVAGMAALIVTHVRQNPSPT